MSKQHLYTVLVSLIESISDDAEVVKQAELKAKEAFSTYVNAKTKKLINVTEDKEAE